MNYVKSKLMTNFLFGIKHKDTIYVSEQIFDAMKDIENSKIDISKLAIFDYDNLEKTKEISKLSDEQFEKAVKYTKFVIDKGQS